MVGLDFQLIFLMLDNSLFLLLAKDGIHNAVAPRERPESPKSPNVWIIRVRSSNCDCKEVCSLNH